MCSLNSRHVDVQWHFQLWFDGLLQLHQQGLSAIPTRSASALLIPIRQVLTTGMIFLTLCWWWEVENINASYWWAKIRPINCTGWVKMPPWLLHLEGRRARWRPMKLTSSDSLFAQLWLELLILIFALLIDPCLSHVAVPRVNWCTAVYVMLF